MSQQNNQDYQDELDVYQTAWVLGRSGKKHTPLTKEQLKMLIEAGRVEVGWLNNEEVGLLGNEVVQGNQVSNEDDKKLKTIEMVVQRILVNIEKQAEEKDKNWKNYSKNMQQFFVRMEFKNLYEQTPEMLLVSLMNQVFN